MLGLRIASAKDSFDAVGQQLKTGAVKTILADRVLVQYGPQAKDARQMLRALPPGTDLRRSLPALGKRNPALHSPAIAPR